jgi:hypothetical protein
MKQKTAFHILFREMLGKQHYHANHIGIISVLRCHLQRASDTASWHRKRKRNGSGIM